MVDTPPDTSRGFFFHPGDLLTPITEGQERSSCPEAFHALTSVSVPICPMVRQSLLQNIQCCIVAPIEHHTTARTNMCAYAQRFFDERATR